MFMDCVSETAILDGLQGNAEQYEVRDLILDEFRAERNQILFMHVCLETCVLRIWNMLILGMSTRCPRKNATDLIEAGGKNLDLISLE